METESAETTDCRLEPADCRLLTACSRLRWENFRKGQLQGVFADIYGIRRHRWLGDKTTLPQGSNPGK